VARHSAHTTSTSDAIDTPLISMRSALMLLMTVPSVAKTSSCAACSSHCW